MSSRRREYDHNNVQATSYMENCDKESYIRFVFNVANFEYQQYHSNNSDVTVVRTVLHIQPESETHISVLWSGNTYNFRKALDDAGVPGAYRDDDDDGTRKYFRCLKSIDITSDPDKVQDVIKDTSKNLAMKVVVESGSVENSDAKEWIDGLRAIECLHFDK